LFVPRSSSTSVVAWTWPTWVVSRRRVLEAVFVLLESLSPSRRIFIGSVGVLDRQTYQEGTRGSRLCGEDRDLETENSKVCARTRDTKFI
jgi:hypothetical protein